MAPGARLEAIPGAPPDLSDLPPGCPFAPRCAMAEAAYATDDPSLALVGEGHVARRRRTDATAPAVA